MSKGIAGYFTGTSGAGQALVAEVIERGDKINPEEVIGITRDLNGEIVWLESGESGNGASGLKHILKEHESNFNEVGIPTDMIADFVLTAVSKGEIIGYQGKGKSRPIYRLIYNGREYKVAITVGSNGYIVGANPRS